jgi:hypothetical protein
MQTIPNAAVLNVSIPLKCGDVAYMTKSINNLDAGLFAFNNLYSNYQKNHKI